MWAVFWKNQWRNVLQNSHNILKKPLKKATVQKENSLFRMVICHKTAERRIMTFTKWGPKKFSRPAWSPYMNPIENVFNYVGTKLLKESFNRNITFKKFEEYSARVKKTLLSVIAENINKTIESMDNRLSSGG